MEEIWLERITKEYEEFKRYALELNKEDIYENAEIIFIYDTIYKYLNSVNTNEYKDLSLKEIYECYMDNIECEFCLTTKNRIEEFLNYVKKEHDRCDFYDKYEEEFLRFKNRFIGERSEVIFNDYERIRFYNLIFNFIQNEEYCDLQDIMKNRSFAELWEKYKKVSDIYNISKRKEITNFLKD